MRTGYFKTKTLALLLMSSILLSACGEVREVPELKEPLTEQASFRPVMRADVGNLKVKIGNPVNKFLGTITLELYLVHGLFVEIFGPYIILERAMSKTPIRNIFVYVIVVFAVSVPLAWLVSLGNKRIKNLLTKPKAS